MDHFAPIIVYDYTAKMENLLDAIAAGKTPELGALTVV
jgi:hypothetical protein